MNILMHLCCANCALYPVTKLRAEGHSIHGYWFNPNIHPLTEYRLRLGAVRQLADIWSLPVQYDDEYGLVEFVRTVAGQEHERCGYCYRVRLDATARRAKELGMDGFTTSLLVSPYQKFDTILEAGQAAAEHYGIAFYGEDFRPGYREGMNMSRELGLYRQKYCGCIYSEMERYAETKADRKRD